MRYLKVFSLFFVFAILLSGCEENLTKPEEKKVETPEVYVKNGVLLFKDWNVVFNILMDLDNKNTEQKDLWEKTLGFKSMRSVFNQFVEDEKEMVLIIEERYNNNNKSINESVVNAEYKKLLSKYNKSIIAVELDKGEGKYYDMNLHHQVYAPVVNEDGIICVDGKLYRYTYKDVRTLKKTDWSQVSELMDDNSHNVSYNEIDNSDSKMQPEIIEDPGTDDPNGPSGCIPRILHYPTSNNVELSKTETFVSKYRLIGYLNFEQNQYVRIGSDCSRTCYVLTFAHFKVRSLVRVVLLFGTWQNYNIPMDIDYRLLYEIGSNRYDVKNLFGPESFVGHTYTKNLLSKTTTSIHPKAILFQFSARNSAGNAGFYPTLSMQYYP